MQWSGRRPMLEFGSPAPDQPELFTNRPIPIRINMTWPADDLIKRPRPFLTPPRTASYIVRLSLVPEATPSRVRHIHSFAVSELANGPHNFTNSLYDEPDINVRQLLNVYVPSYFLPTNEDATRVHLRAVVEPGDTVFPASWSGQSYMFKSASFMLKRDQGDRSVACEGQKGWCEICGYAPDELFVRLLDGQSRYTAERDEMFGAMHVHVEEAYTHYTTSLMEGYSLSHRRRVLMYSRMRDMTYPRRWFIKWEPFADDGDVCKLLANPEQKVPQMPPMSQHAEV
ncbi:hypothetical protein HK101_000467 [Irineochytrium annulatum]|nr:hypothetical protein HK101_000467 [Irineochytrium annulatum]